MSNAHQRRKTKIGGLHVTFRKNGDAVTVKHEGETLEIVWQGTNGKGQYVVSFKGPKSFDIKIQRNNYPEEE